MGSLSDARNAGGFFMDHIRAVIFDRVGAPSRAIRQANRKRWRPFLFCPDLSYSRQPYCEEDNMKRTLFAAGIIRGGVARWYPRRKV